MPAAPGRGRGPKYRHAHLRLGVERCILHQRHQLTDSPPPAGVRCLRWFCSPCVLPSLLHKQHDTRFWERSLHVVHTYPSCILIANRVLMLGLCCALVALSPPLSPLTFHSIPPRRCTAILTSIHTLLPTHGQAALMVSRIPFSHAFLTNNAHLYAILSSDFHHRKS